MCASRSRTSRRTPRLLLAALVGRSRARPGPCRLARHGLAHSAGHDAGARNAARCVSATGRAICGSRVRGGAGGMATVSGGTGATQGVARGRSCGGEFRPVDCSLEYQLKFANGDARKPVKSRRGPATVTGTAPPSGAVTSLTTPLGNREGERRPEARRPLRSRHHEHPRGRVGGALDGPQALAHAHLTSGRWAVVICTTSAVRTRSLRLLPWLLAAAASCRAPAAGGGHASSGR